MNATSPCTTLPRSMVVARDVVSSWYVKGNVQEPLWTVIGATGQNIVRSGRSCTDTLKTTYWTRATFLCLYSPIASISSRPCSMHGPPETILQCNKLSPQCRQSLPGRTKHEHIDYATASFPSAR